MQPYCGGKLGGEVGGGGEGAATATDCGEEAVADVTVTPREIERAAADVVVTSLSAASAEAVLGKVRMASTLTEADDTVRTTPVAAG